MSEVSVTRAPAQGMITLRGDLTDQAVVAAATGVSGTAFPAQRSVVFKAGYGLAWMAPDEVLLLLPAEQVTGAIAQLSAALADVHHLIADVSDARAVFSISGARAREVLAKGAPVDLSPKAFGPGQIRRTRLAQVAAAFWMPDPNSFTLVCFASVSEYVQAFLVTAAQQGSVPEHF